MLEQKRRWSETLILLLCLAVSTGQVYGQAFQPPPPSDWTVRSPGGKLECRVVLNHDANSPQLTYSISFDGAEAISPSPLGLQFAELPGLSSGPIKFLETSQRSTDTRWHNILGKNNPVRDNYREMTLSFRASDAQLDVIVRAYDDGIAFRYRVPNRSPGAALTLTRENTEIRFGSDPAVWAATYDKYTHPYEHEYTKLRLGSLYASQLIGLPLLVEASPKVYIGITEAELTNWSGMYLRSTSAAAHQTALRADLSPRPDGSGLVRMEAGESAVSPWRVFLIGDRPGALVESDLVVNLNQPSAIKDTRWIEPGKIAWDHWWSGDVRMDNETEKRFIQFASDMGFPYQLVDWQWYGPFNKPGADITKPAPQLDWNGLLAFAREKNVRLWVWLHSGDVSRALQVGTLDEAFRVYENWGLAGVKIDFMDRDDQEMVAWYEHVVQLAAKHHLMVDFHGAYKPTGLRRTWPNLLTREGVLGNEYNKFSGRVTPEHKLTLPFTRMLAGPMDFTPGGFLNRSPAEWRQTTPTEVMGSRAQELALFVVYESPLECVADDPEHYRGQPGLQFIKDVPTVWDETRVLAGSVGRHIVVARRSGKDWFLGGMAGDDSYQTDLSLEFLGKGNYKAEIYADPTDPLASYEALQVSARPVTGRDHLPIAMRAAGGVAICFRAEQTRAHGTR